ncbi:MAG: arsenic resistance N-acetyltransferase ArsN2 [Chitinophagaceae bacterium]
MEYSINANKASASDHGDAIKLLESQKLPHTDIDKNLTHFFVVREADKLQGLIGLEIYGDSGLLRSMATSPLHRNKGIATLLVTKLLGYAKTLGLKEVFLFTETAAEFFQKRGFQYIRREEAPEDISQSSEFTHLCPSSAILMKKEIT